MFFEYPTSFPMTFPCCSALQNAHTALPRLVTSTTYTSESSNQSTNCTNLNSAARVATTRSRTAVRAASSKVNGHPSSAATSAPAAACTLAQHGRPLPGAPKRDGIWHLLLVQPRKLGQSVCQIVCRLLVCRSCTVSACNLNAAMQHRFARHVFGEQQWTAIGKWVAITRRP